MSLITIDETRCKRDGFCVKDCPAVILRQKDKQSVPVMLPNTESSCLVCGHCVAACPHDAIIHHGISMETSPKIQKKLVVGKDTAIQFLRSRRSIRRYKDKPVDMETIQFLIDNARYAPTGGNTQLIKWTVFTDKAKIKNIADLTVQWMKEVYSPETAKKLPSYVPPVIAAHDAGFDPITHYAPCLIFASTTSAYDSGTVDLSIALSYLELLAVSCGLGTCWMGMIKLAMPHSRPLQEAMGLPEGHNTHAYPMIIGHPKYKYYRVPERKPAKISWK